MHSHHTRWATRALLVVASIALSGCYTVLRAPGVLSSSAGEVGDTYAGRSDAESTTTRYDHADDVYDADDIYDAAVYDDGRYDSYGSGYPVTRYDSRQGLYGFGSPFAYGPGLGYSYAYAPSYGPYGYGYDPYYYGSSGTYVPPGYELVTDRELQDLRDSARNASTTPPPVVDHEALRRQRERETEQAWTQRSVQTRPSSSEFRTPRTTSSSSSTVSSSSSSSAPKKSSTKSSGTSAASKRSKRGR